MIKTLSHKQLDCSGPG